LPHATEQWQAPEDIAAQGSAFEAQARRRAMKAIATNRLHMQNTSKITVATNSKDVPEAYSVALTFIVLAALVAGLVIALHVVGFPLHFAPLVIH
jgi:hypothetical protein